MSASEHSELQDLIADSFFGHYGGRASTDEVLRSLVPDLPEHLQNYILSTGLKTAIRGFFRRQRADGLPQAPEANPEGLHVQLDFLSVPEFQYVIERQLKASESARLQAAKLAELCEAIHGVRIPLISQKESA